MTEIVANMKNQFQADQAQNEKLKQEVRKVAQDMQDFEDKLQNIDEHVKASLQKDLDGINGQIQQLITAQAAQNQQIAAFVASLQQTKDHLEESIDKLGTDTKKELEMEVNKVNEKLTEHEERHQQLDEQDKCINEQLDKVNKKADDKLS